LRSKTAACEYQKAQKIHAKELFVESYREKIITGYSKNYGKADALSQGSQMP
jgi:hypothetical protein